MRKPNYKKIFSEAQQIKTAERVFRTTILTLTEADLLTPPLIEVVDRYARTYSEWEFAAMQAEAQPPVKKGPQGGDVWNMNWSAVKKLDDMLRQFEKQLGVVVEKPVQALKSEVSSPADDYI